MSEKPFYHEYSYYGDSVKPGYRIKIERSIEFNEFADALAPYVAKGTAALERERKASEAKEQEIFARLEAGSQEWAKQAAQTLILDKALEYLNLPEIPHTSNKWTVSKDGTHEISNLVYLMRYRIYPNSSIQASGWMVSWYVLYNVHEHIKKWRSIESYAVAMQEKKKYENEAAAQRYMQGRIDTYAHLFTELSPPVPEKEKYLFCFNGHLLPGYTLAPHEPTPDELLAFVNEQDIGGADMFKKPPARKETGKPKHGKAR